jgi:hypothetical protein
MGLKKRRFSGSGAASHAIIAAKDQQLGVSAQSAKKESPRLFQARHAAGERVVTSELLSIQ